MKKITLAINPLFISHLILKAKSFHAREVADIEEDSSNPTDDMITSALAIQNEDSDEDPVFNELKILIQKLDPDQMAELVAIMWIGREDYHPDDWFVAIEEAKLSLTNFTAEYLLSKPQVAEFLESGLNKLGYECENA